MTSFIKPERLKSDGTIALIAPAGSLFNPNALEDIKLFLKAKGFQVKILPHVLDNYLDFAGSVEARLNDIHECFSDKSVQAILCLRGGNGSARLLNELNYNLIKANPKIVVGFSDITHLLLAIHSKANLITYHGPTGSNLINNEYNYKMFTRCLTDPKSLGVMANDSQIGNVKPYAISYGEAKGKLIGGCLTIICQLLGTDFDIDTSDKILFLEDVSEEPFNIDKMLTRLKLTKKFENVKGIILGQFINCEPGQSGRQRSLKNKSTPQILSEFFKDLNIPVICDYNIGHTSNNLTIPLGAMAKIKASSYNDCHFEILESGVN